MTNERPDDEQPDETPDQSDTEGLKAEAEKWKALARKHEADAKKNRDAAKRLAELEDGNKSEIEKALADKQAAEDRAAAAELNLARTNVALRKGLTEAQAKRLQGATEEDLEADADDLLALLKPAAEQPSEEPDRGGLQRRPQERLSPGARPNAEPQMTAKEIVDKAEALTAL